VTSGASEQEQRHGIASALHRADLTLDELWMRYFALGGTAGLMEVEAYLHELMPLPAGQRDMLAHAVNERLRELTPAGPAPYSRGLREGTPQRGPLTALVGLLEGARLAPPEDLPVIAAAAGRALDTELVVYLVDYGQRELMPLPNPAVPGQREGLGVDSTLAGRAFRHGQVLPSDADGQPRLWVPLLDGGERLGVLEVLVEDVLDLYDPVLRDQLGWLAAQLGHLVTAMSQYGDALDCTRLVRPRTPAAQLIWSLLPPLAAGTAVFSVAGLLEPSASVGGDAFDYALATSHISLAVFDGMGHGLAAGLMASAAVAAYRVARRDGRSLREQARAVDEVIAEQFADGLLTGVLAELDLTTGRLRYVAAGHPHPLLLRNGQIVKTLTAGRRTPFGIDRDSDEVTVGEEDLEPGDWLVLHTDGVTEARSVDGAFFGEHRLMDFLEREAASGHPPAETVRRLLRAVLSYQDGILQDDATVLLARWDASAVIDR
jgi:hypothetical protein